MTTDIDTILDDIPCLSDLRWNLLAELSDKPHERQRAERLQERITQAQFNGDAELTLFFYAYVVAHLNARLH